MSIHGNYSEFFLSLTDRTPLPYQASLAQGPWPDLLDIPTGLGKTAALGGAWLWKRLQRDSGTGRRLVYCLPMRVLVEQTRDVFRGLVEKAAPCFAAQGQEPPRVCALMGGFVDEDWELEPEHGAILVGTQDMLLSRALNRGYAMSRYKWPVHFGLLNSDCLWVFDEVQLMGVGVETSAQLSGLRQQLGTQLPIASLWASATLTRSRFETIDHRSPTGGFSVCRLEKADRNHAVVRERLNAKKPLIRTKITLSATSSEAYAQQLAKEVAQLHESRPGLTLVVVNRIARAQALYRALRSHGVGELGLVHSRFRAPDRRRHEALLHAETSRIVVTTQALEAGVDVSARTLVTELAPWPSLVQRLGRCNRYGEQGDAKVFWIDIDSTDDESLALPYETKALADARALLDARQDGGPGTLAGVEYEPPSEIRPILRRRDLFGLFDTTPDLTGYDLDVSGFIRDGEDNDVHVYYRQFPDDELPDADLRAPSRDELCAVSIETFAKFLQTLKRLRKSGDAPGSRRAGRKLAQAYRWDALERKWVPVERTLPGSLALLHPSVGGYDPEIGWTNEPFPETPVPPVESSATDFGREAASSQVEAYDADTRSSIGRWIGLTDHLGHVETEARALVASLELPESQGESVVTAARWHDVGKAHDEFQRRLVEPALGTPDAPPQSGAPWAKSNHHRKPGPGRSYFRHELASALAWLAAAGDAHKLETDLVAYLIAAHHGKVRLSLRSVPGETPPPSGVHFARGIWDGESLPSEGDVLLPTGDRVGPFRLDLSLMQLGEGSWLERTLALCEHSSIGPFRLAYLESLVRIADWRASRKEASGEYDE